MYLRQYTRLSFNDGFDLFRRLKLINVSQIDPVHYIQKPPEADVGYPLKNEVKDMDNQRVINKLIQRYPDLQYAPIQKVGPGEFQNEASLFRFLKLYNQQRQKGLNFQKAFEKAETMFQSAMQRKIDQTKIANNLAITNQARSFMSLAKQEIEYESRLKRDRLLRDLQIQEIEKESPYDPSTQALIEKYKKSLIKIVHVQDQPEEVPPKDQEIEFQDRVKNVFDCYYSRVAMKDRLNGLSDKEILSNVRSSPTKIKNELKKTIKFLEKYNIKIDDDLNMVIPSDLPNEIKERVRQSSYYIAMLYKDLDYEFDHHEHLDQIKQALKKQEETPAEEKEEKGEEDEEEIEVDEEAEKQIKKALKDADIKITATNKLFESEEERLKRLQIKWLHRKIEELEVTKFESDKNNNPENVQIINERIQKMQNKVTELVDNLRKIKLELEFQSVVKTGKQLFQEHSVLMDDKELFIQATQLQLHNIDSYFQIPQDQRRLTSIGQMNDDIIHSLIKVQNLKSHISKLHGDEIENKIFEKSIEKREDEQLMQRIAEQYKLREMKKRNLRKQAIDDEFVENENEVLDDATFAAEFVDDLTSLVEKQKELRSEQEKEKAELKKKQDDELKSQQAVKGQKGSKKKKKAK